jgi:hypothetical protein
MRFSFNSAAGENPALDKLIAGTNFESIPARLTMTGPGRQKPRVDHEFRISGTDPGGIQRARYRISSQRPTTTVL